MPCRWEARAEAPATPELRRDRGWSPPSPLARRLASRSPVSRRRGLAHDSGMGQVLSIPFISKTSLSAAAAARARRRKKKGKKRNNLWKSIVTTVFSLFGRNPTSGAIQAKESTPTDGKIESERKEVAVQQTKENNEQKLTSTCVACFGLSYMDLCPKYGPICVAQFYAENHSHIVCEHSRGNFTSVISFLAGKDKFKSVDVPGKKDKSGKKVQIKVAREVVRRILIGIFIRFRHLHSEGKTLNGCFTAENICVPVYKKDEDILMAPYIEVKLDSLHPDSFQAYTDDGGNKDLMRVGWILENSIFSSETEVPSDLKHLLELLHSDPIVNKNLIYSHVCLMGPRDQISYYHWLYKRLVYLKKKVPNSYKNIMQKIAADDWKSKAESNEFLAMLHPSSRYSKDGKGLSHFYRNSVEHLFKVIEDQKRNSASMVEEELQDYHIVYILTEAFPQFLADLQKAFYEEGELDTFNREDSA